MSDPYGKRMEAGDGTGKTCWKSWVNCWAIICFPVLAILALPWVFLGVLCYPFVAPCRWCCDDDNCWTENFYGIVKGQLCCICDLRTQIFYSD